MIVIDQTHEIVERRDRPWVVEGEPVTVGEHAARRTDVVQVDALKIVGGVVSPLPDASSVEPGFVGSAAVRVDGQPGQQRPQGVDVAGGPAHREQLSEIDARGVEKVSVEVHRDARIGQLRHAPQHTVTGELIHDRRLPAACGVRPQRFRDVHQSTAVGVSGEVGIGQPEDIVCAAACGVGAQRIEIGGVWHHIDPHIDIGVKPGELVERFPVGGGDLLIPQAHGDDRSARGFRGSAKQYRGDEQQRHGDGHTRRGHRGNLGAQCHLSPVTTIERTMCLPSATNNTTRGTIATVVAAITNVHCAL